MDLAALQAGPDGRGGQSVPVDITRKSMARFVGNDLHIVGGAVEIGKDEGAAVLGKTGGVAAGSLAGLAYTSITSFSRMKSQNSAVSGLSSW